MSELFTPFYCQITFRCTDITCFVYSFFSLWSFELLLLFKYLWIMLLWNLLFKYFCGFVFSFGWNCWDYGNPTFSILRNCQTAQSKWMKYMVCECYLNKAVKNVDYFPSRFDSLALLVRFPTELFTEYSRCSTRPLHIGWLELESFLPLCEIWQLLSL